MLLRCLFIRPQRCTVIGIVKSRCPCFLLFLPHKTWYLLQADPSGTGIQHEKYGYDPAHPHPLLPSGSSYPLPVFLQKRKSSLSLADFHKSQCSKIIFVQEHTLGIHVFFLKNRFQELSVHIFSCFTDKCSMSSPVCLAATAPLAGAPPGFLAYSICPSSLIS